VTVALNGDGGDELFAGYVRFWAAATTERIPPPLRRAAGLAARFVPRGSGIKSGPARLWRLLSAVDRPLGDRTTFWNCFFAFALDDLLRPEMAPPGEAVLEFHRRYFRSTNGHSALAAVLAHNFDTYLPNDLLVKMDRMSMAHALETRSPFLDTALMEYVAGLPDGYKLRGRTTKSILRDAFADLLPVVIQRRAKMGFGVPLGAWFRSHLRDYVSDHLATPHARINAYVRSDAVMRLWREHLEGRADHGHQLWLLLTMEIWLRSLSRLAEPWDGTALEVTPTPVSVHA
jgi:asparagine synthase (glutamine-hydrolysing)